jgi:CRP-like cAMP-binding protein
MSTTLGRSGQVYSDGQDSIMSGSSSTVPTAAPGPLSTTTTTTTTTNTPSMTATMTGASHTSTMDESVLGHPYMTVTPERRVSTATISHTAGAGASSSASASGTGTASSPRASSSSSSLSRSRTPHRRRSSFDMADTTVFSMVEGDGTRSAGSPPILAAALSSSVSNSSTLGPDEPRKSRLLAKSSTPVNPNVPVALRKFHKNGTAGRRRRSIKRRYANFTIPGPRSRLHSGSQHNHDRYESVHQDPSAGVTARHHSGSGSGSGSGSYTGSPQRVFSEERIVGGTYTDSTMRSGNSSRGYGGHGSSTPPSTSSMYDTSTTCTHDESSMGDAEYHSMQKSMSGFSSPSFEVSSPSTALSPASMTHRHSLSQCTPHSLSTSPAHSGNSNSPLSIMTEDKQDHNLFSSSHFVASSAPVPESSPIAITTAAAASASSLSSSADVFPINMTMVSRSPSISHVGSPLMSPTSSTPHRSISASSVLARSVDPAKPTDPKKRRVSPSIEAMVADSSAEPPPLYIDDDLGYISSPSITALGPAAVAVSSNSCNSGPTPLGYGRRAHSTPASPSQVRQTLASRPFMWPDEIVTTTHAPSSCACATSLSCTCTFASSVQLSDSHTNRSTSSSATAASPSTVPQAHRNNVQRSSTAGGTSDAMLVEDELARLAFSLPTHRPVVVSKHTSPFHPSWLSSDEKGSSSPSVAAAAASGAAGTGTGTGTGATAGSTTAADTSTSGLRVRPNRAASDTFNVGVKAPTTGGVRRRGSGSRAALINTAHSLSSTQDSTSAGLYGLPSACNNRIQDAMTSAFPMSSSSTNADTELADFPTSSPAFLSDDDNSEGSELEAMPSSGAVSMDAEHELPTLEVKLPPGYSARGRSRRTAVSAEADQTPGIADKLSRRQSRGVSRRAATLQDVYDAPDLFLMSMMPQAKTESVHHRLASALESHILFRGLNPEQMQALCNVMYSHNICAGEFLYSFGDAADDMYVVESGHLVSLTTSGIGTLRQTGEFNTDDVIGEIALMYSCARNDSVRATTDATLWCLNRAAYRRILIRSNQELHHRAELFLKTFQVLYALSDDERTQIASALKPVEFHDGEYIIKQGEIGTKFYLLESGSVKVTQGLSSLPTEIDIATVGAGGYFGELALISDQRRSANVISVGDTRCLCLKKTAFLSLMQDCIEDMLHRASMYRYL